MKKKTSKVRLSKHIIPKKYSILLAPDLENFTFSGEEEISIEVLRETNSITLHAVELEIFKAEIMQGRKILPAKIFYNIKEETVSFKFAEKISQGKGTLKIFFKGILNDKMRGFYRSKYHLDGKIHHMGVTQFESTDARRAIPCFDEPSFKAVFEVSLKIPSDRTAISNTLESEIIEHESGFKTVRFTPSPEMSSYLLAFIVGHFEYIEKKTKEGVLVRVFVTPGKLKQAEFALDVAARTISFYSNYFGISYPLPVLDLIAIPDFAAGAMENWGAVTYRETAVLVDPLETSTHNKQWVALVIAHELAHQWFGNLVTMEWWTHLWLNEGFASYMEYVAIDKLFPKWKVWTQFIFIEQGRGLSLDGLKNTHAIEIDVNHPAEISEIFDAVSYSKGASVIRMLAEYLGENNFRKGLKHYLEKHAYKNASTNDLWDAFEKVSGKPVKRIMTNWTRKPGYPLITLKQNEKNIEISQSRFFSSPLIKDSDNTLWLVPIALVGKGFKKAKYFLLKNKKTKIQGFKGWVKLNAEEKSFIRSSYPPNFLALLEKPIKEKIISQEDRFGIIRDAFALSQASKMSTGEALKLAAFYKSEDSYIVWAEITSQMLGLGKLLFNTPLYEPFKIFSQGLFKDIVNKVGWSKKPKEIYSQTLLRSTVVYALGTSGDKKIIKKAKEIFEKFYRENTKLDPDLRGMVYNLAAENGTEKEYEKFMELYKRTSFQEEKDRILRALCMFKDKKLLNKTLGFSLSQQAKSQDILKTISFVWANPWGRKVAFDYLKNHWSMILKKFEGGHLFSRFVMPAGNFVTKEEAKEVEKFFKKNFVPGIERTVTQVLEQIRSNAAWFARDKSKIKKFLKSSL